MTKSDNLSSQQSDSNNSLANIHKWVCTAKVASFPAQGVGGWERGYAYSQHSFLPTMCKAIEGQAMTKYDRERPLACFSPASDSLSSQHSLLHSLLWRTTVSNSTHAILSVTQSVHSHVPVLSSPGESLGSVLEWPGRLEEEKEERHSSADKF